MTLMLFTCSFQKKWIVGALECYSPALAIYYGLDVFSQRCRYAVCSSYSSHIVVVVKLEAYIFFCIIFPWSRHDPNGLKPQL